MKCFITIFIRQKIQGQKHLGDTYDTPAYNEVRSCSVPMAISETASLIERKYRTILPAYQIRQSKSSTWNKRFYRINFTEQQKRDIRRNCSDNVRQNLLNNDFAGTAIINVIN